MAGDPPEDRAESRHVKTMHDYLHRAADAITSGKVPKHNEFESIKAWHNNMDKYIELAGSDPRGEDDPVTWQMKCRHCEGHW